MVKDLRVNDSLKELKEKLRLSIMGIKDRVLFLSVTTVFLSACTEARFNSSFSFNESSNEIRYEGIDFQGQITEAKIVTDPMRDLYFHGDWTEATTKIASKNVSSSTGSMNRVHIVFLGDGYTDQELSNYTQDVQSNIQMLLSQQPFKAYQNYLAFHQVNLVSTDSGVSVVGGISKSTALQMQYGCQNVDRLLCVNISKAAAAASQAPKADVIFALANSDQYGGAGYMSPAIATLAARNSAATELALHELGHSFGKLTDEYDSAGVPASCNSFANTSTIDRLAMLAKKTKWFRWLDLTNVGTFQGSCYSVQNFRPTQNSKMRTLGMNYDPVNTEQLIFRIYEKVRPIEFATPQGKIKRNQILKIGVLEQVETPLEITWSLNGKVLSNYQGRTEIDTAELGIKKGSLSVTVTDRTSRVRDEELRKKLMSQTLTWILKL